MSQNTELYRLLASVMVVAGLQSIVAWTFVVGAWLWLEKLCERRGWCEVPEMKRWLDADPLLEILQEWAAGGIIVVICVLFGAIAGTLDIGRPFDQWTLNWLWFSVSPLVIVAPIKAFEWIIDVCLKWIFGWIGW